MSSLSPNLIPTLPRYDRIEKTASKDSDCDDEWSDRQALLSSLNGSSSSSSSNCNGNGDMELIERGNSGMNSSPGAVHFFGGGGATGVGGGMSGIAKESSVGKYDSTKPFSPFRSRNFTVS